MKLRAKLMSTAAAVIVPTALGLIVLDAIARHRAAARILESIVVERIAGERTECEADPSRWGLRHGPRDGGPPPHEGRPPPHDGDGPRPAEAFAYDASLRSSHPHAPAIPEVLARSIADAPRAIESFAWRSREVEILLRTPWNEGPCAYVLARGTTGDWGAVLPESWLWALPTVAVIVALVLALGPMVARLRRLTEAVGRSASDAYRERVALDDRDEIGELARAFDTAGTALRGELELRARREQALREFLANTTHDVMIPLTVLQGHLATLRDRVAQGAEADTVTAAMVEAHYIASLLQNLAAAARLDGQGEALQRGAVELGELVARVIARHRPIAIERGVALDHAVPATPLVAAADLTLLEQAVGNLVHNAVRYTPQGGHVAVILEPVDTSRFSLRVVDDGPGVADDELLRITARGIRSDAARTRAPQGQGLGLDIALRAAMLHGFTLGLARSEFGGLEAKLEGPTHDTASVER